MASENPRRVPPATGRSSVATGSFRQPEGSQVVGEDQPPGHDDRRYPDQYQPRRSSGFPPPESGFPPPESGFPPPQSGFSPPESGFPPPSGFPPSSYQPPAHRPSAGGHEPDSHHPDDSWPDQDDDPYQQYQDHPDYADYFDADDDAELVDATSSITRSALEWAVVLVGAVLVALLLRASLFQAFYIPSESMESTLLINDRVLVNKVSYRLHDIHRGDVVVFVRPENQEGEIRDLIKRVIALPGETVEARDSQIYIDGQPMFEPYLDEGVVTADFPPTVVPDGHIFVMGDNRTESYDSRVFGSIAEDRVIGRAFVLIWPVGRLGAL